MEFATGSDRFSRPFDRYPPLNAEVRPMKAQESAAVTDLLERAGYHHAHADWYGWRYWLDLQRFWLSWEARPEPTLAGGLVISSEVLPVAWVRILALHRDPFSRQRLWQHARILFDTVIPKLQAEEVSQLLWMSDKDWVQRWAPDFGFQLKTKVVTLTKDETGIPAGARINSDIQVRDALPEEMRQLAQIETAVYEPMWRYTPASLLRAYKQSLSFQVARWQGKIVGYQQSTATEQNGAHLARITVTPEAQGIGVGRTLLVHALQTYVKRGCTHVSLNTQADNGRAQDLYRRFGFVPTGHEVPIWELCLG